MKNIKSTTTRKEKWDILSRVRKNPNEPIKVLAIMFIALPTLFVSLLASYAMCINSIGDGAYKYSDDTYALLETAIEDCVQEEIGLDALELQQRVTKYVVTYENN